MNKIGVKVNHVMSEILQKLAFERGWRWNGLQSTNVSHLERPYLYFYFDEKVITYANSAGYADNVSLEEIINRIVEKEKDIFIYSNDRSFKVKFHEDGISIGCTVVPKEDIKKIYERYNKEFGF